MQKNSGIMKSGLDAMPLFLLDDLLRFLGEIYLIFLTLVQLLHQKDNKSKNKSNGKISISQFHPYGANTVNSIFFLPSDNFLSMSKQFEVDVLTCSGYHYCNQ